MFVLLVVVMTAIVMILCDDRRPAHLYGDHLYGDHLYGVLPYRGRRGRLRTEWA